MDFALEVFTDIIKYSISELPGMILGVGSITDAKAASQYMLAGANFVVTPVFRENWETLFLTYNWLSLANILVIFASRPGECRALAFKLFVAFFLYNNFDPVTVA